jgi:hypothetical protein
MGNKNLKKKFFLLKKKFLGAYLKFFGILTLVKNSLYKVVLSAYYFVRHKISFKIVPNNTFFNSYLPKKIYAFFKVFSFLSFF